MNLKQLIKFGLENSSDPVIKNPILRDALEPRSMDLAALSDDVVPGSLKDELEGKFDPSQETHEEYLQRINLERPFNMANGGSTIPIGPRAMVGEITDEQTKFGRPVYKTPEGERVSEKSVTLFLNGKWMNVPSIHGGKSFNEAELRRMIKLGNIEPTSVHKSKDEAETAAKERSASMAEGGQLVAPSVDGSRPGYSGDYTAEERKKQGRTKVLRDGKWMYDLHTPELKKWYKKNYPDKSWWDQKYKSDILDRYYNELGREEPPKGYITTKEYAKKHGFKIYPATDAKSEGNIIRNLLVRTGDERQLTRDYNEPTKKFFTDELEPRYFKTTYELAPGKKSARNILYVKDKGKAHANKLLKYWDGTQLRDHTIKNINNILNKEEYKPLRKLFEAGNYDGIKQALKKMKGITDAERANVMLRIAQGMSGHGFRDYKPDIKLNKVAANKIFKGFEKETWGTPFSDRYRDIKRNAVMKDLGDGYFTKSYKGFIADARNSIGKAFPSLDISNMDINELTGLTSGYKNKTFTSTQFVNLMDAEFNRKQHASMIKIYGQHEARLQKALSGKRPNYDAAANEVKKWKAWKKDWFDNLDPRYKTEQIKSILPDFKITDKASKVFTEKRLADFRKQNFPIEEEIKKMKYVKTAGTKKIMSETPLLREVAAGDSKAMERIKKQLISLCSKGQASGGRIGFATGTPTVQCGANELNKLLKQGKGNTPLVKKILQGGGNLLKEGIRQLNPKELLRLRNLIGPAAVGFMAAYEGGVITDDVLRKGIPLNESVAKNWLTKSFVPFSEEFARQKNLLQSGTLTDNQKIYALDMMKAEKAFKEMNRIEGMEANQLIEGTMDDDFIFNSQEDIDAAKTNVNRILGDLDSSGSLDNTGMQMENIRAMDEMEASRMAKPKTFNIGDMEIQYSDGYSPIFGKSGTPLVNKLATPAGRRMGPMTAKREMNIDYSLPTYDRMPTPTDQDILNTYRQYGVISPTEFKKGVLQPGEGTLIRMMQGGEGLYGSQFAGGGIAGIRRPHAIPPKSGPTPQGLPSMLNRVRRI